MKKIIFLLSIFLLSQSNFSQSLTNFNKAIKEHVKKYNVQSEVAHLNKDNTKAQELFDSLVNHHLIGTQFENFTLKEFGSRKVTLSKFKKPIFILTYASWCIPSKGEIPALNKLAQKYAKNVKIIVLFWNKKHQLKDVARKFNPFISVCYAHETYKNDENLISHVKHTLGFPTSYFLDENLRVISIKRGGAQPPKNSTYIKAFTMNYNVYREGLGCLLIEKNISKERLTTN